MPCSPSTTSRQSNWKHLRTSNPVESTFATVRYRTVRSKGCLSNKTALAMVFKLAQAAVKHWRRLAGQNPLPKVDLGVRFTDGIEVAKEQAQTAAGPRSSPTFDDSSIVRNRRLITESNELTAPLLQTCNRTEDCNGQPRPARASRKKLPKWHGI